jgi:hypothetical protein
MVSQAVAAGNVSALNYFVAQQYLKALGQFAQAPNQKILMLPIEATGVLASLGGIAEIARETFGGGLDGRGPASPPPARRSPSPTGPTVTPA